MPKQLPFSEVDEDEKTTIESGWEEEPSTTVEQGEIADKLAGMPRRSITSVTSTNAGPIDEATVDDQHMNLMSIVTPVAAPARIVITQGNETGAELEIRPGKQYTIGRGVDNDIVLTDIAVSRKHFDLRHEGGAWVLVDRGSGNGTLVNGNLEDQPFLLASGDAIEIGNTTFRFEQANGAPRPVESMDVDIGGSMGDDEEEPSTVAGKPLRAESYAPPQQHVPPMRPATLPPPMPMRSRSPSVGPAPMPPAPPPPMYPPPAQRRPATLMGSAEHQHMGQGHALPGIMPSTLPGQGMPMPPGQPQLLGSQPQMMAYGYAHPNEMPQPYVIDARHGNGHSSREAPATSLVQPTPYGGMPAQAPYVAHPVPSLSRRTKMILGGVALTAFAAILTIAVVRSGGNNTTTPATPINKALVQTPPAKPTVEAIKEPTVKPIEAPKKTVETPAKAVETPLPKAVVIETPKKTIDAPPPPPKKAIVVEAPPPPPKKEPPPKKVVAETPPPPRKETPKRVANTEPASTRVAIDSSGAKAKAAQQFAAKAFQPAIQTLKTAAASASPDDAKELLQLARIYDQFFRNYNMGTAPGTPPTDAYVSLIKARNFDSSGTFKSEIEAKLGEISQKAAVGFMGKSQFVEAFNAVRTSESLSGANGTTKAVRSKLESQAGELYQSAAKDMPADAAKEKLRTVMKMVESKSPWYQKAQKLLLNPG